MASFIEDLWSSVFTPGPTPSLLIATNATFAALQFLLLILLIATYSIHFLILSVLSGGLWYSINWFAREMQAEAAKNESMTQKAREKSLDPDSETETETNTAPIARKSAPNPAQKLSSSLDPSTAQPGGILRKRRSLGDSSDYVSTDSEWEKVSEGEEKSGQ